MQKPAVSGDTERAENFSDKTFSFGYLNVNKNLEWFRTLLELTLPADPDDPLSTHAQFAATMSARLKVRIADV